MSDQINSRLVATFTEQEQVKKLRGMKNSRRPKGNVFVNFLVSFYPSIFYTTVSSFSKPSEWNTK